jgi:uncharacterized protein YbjT (DUF2867 family)
MSPLVAITGATGNIGKALALDLLGRGVRVRAVARRGEALAPLAAKGAEAHAGDLGDAAFLADAFRGADAAFAMIPPHVTAPDVRAYQRRIGGHLADALAKARVARVVLLSSVGAGLPSGTGPIAGLHEMEERLAKMEGIASVSLRAAFFMENHIAGIPLIKSAGINGSAARGDVPLPMVATRDVAAAAADLLAAPAFAGHATRDVFGPRDYTHREATAILGAAIGKPALVYVEFSYEDFRKAIVGMGFSESVAGVFVEMYEAFNSGRIQATVKRTAESTTPTTLERFAREVFAPAFAAA